MHRITSMNLLEQLLVNRTRSDERFVVCDCFFDFRVREIHVRGTRSRAGHLPSLGVMPTVPLLPAQTRGECIDFFAEHIPDGLNGVHGCGS